MTRNPPWGRLFLVRLLRAKGIIAKKEFIGEAREIEREMLQVERTLATEQ